MEDLTEIIRQGREGRRERIEGGKDKTIGAIIKIRLVTLNLAKNKTLASQGCHIFFHLLPQS